MSTVVLSLYHVHLPFPTTLPHQATKHLHNSQWLGLSTDLTWTNPSSPVRTSQGDWLSLKKSQNVLTPPSCSPFPALIDWEVWPTDFSPELQITPPVILEKKRLLPCVKSGRGPFAWAHSSLSVWCWASQYPFPKHKNILSKVSMHTSLSLLIG